MREIIVLTGGLLFLGLFWTFTDPRHWSSLKARLIGYLQPFQVAYYLGAIFVFMLLLLNLIRYPQYLLPDEPLFAALGYALYSGGFIILVWAKVTMGKNWGMPGQHDARRQTRLVIEGPFQFTRNPIYLGYICLGAGYFLLLRSYLVAVMIFVFVRFYLAIRKEERLLTTHFGPLYKDYMKRVPRFLGHRVI